MGIFIELLEAVRKYGNDEMVDKALSNFEEVMTLPFNYSASMELGRVTNVVVNPDRTFMFIDGKKVDDKVREILKKYDLEEVE